MKNEILYAGKWIPSGDRMKPTVQTPKRGGDYVQPDYARFKLVLEYANSGKRLWYFSYEFTKEGASEADAYEHLRKRIVERKNPDLYNFISVWMNLTDNLSTKEKNFNFECYTVKAGMNVATERNPVFYPNGNIDIWATKCKYKLPDAVRALEDQEKKQNEYHMKKVREQITNRMIDERAQHLSKSKFL